MEKRRKQFFSYIDEFVSYEYDAMSDDRQQLPMHSLPESKGKGIDGYQRYHHIVLIVTVEQENAIVDLFKQRHWMFVKAGQGQTYADLQEMCDRMSGVSREVYTSDQASNSHKEAKSQQDTNKNGLPGDPSGLSDIGMLSETSFTSLMKADSSIVKVKEERDIEHDESSIAEDIVDVDEVTDTASESEETDTASESDGLGPTSQILQGNTDVNASQVEGNIMMDSDYPTFVSDLTKPNMVEQSNFHPAHATGPKQDTNASATTGIGYKTIELGIQCEICETIFLKKTKFENHVISGQCKWVCKFCKKTFEYSNKKASVKSHHYSLFQKKLEQHKKECDRTCKLCGYSSEERCKLVRHMKFRHSNTKRYACDICFITFKSETILYTHKINKHTGKAGLYRCPQCPKEYMLLSSLSAHLKCSHLGPKRNEVPCSVCGKMLDIYSVKRHEASHKINNLKCDICLAVFNHVSTLREHKRRHNKDYSHCCESCGKGFYTISKLADHRRIHTGEKPFSCSLCQYRCNIKVNLDKHMKIHGKPSNQRQ